MYLLERKPRLLVVLSMMAVVVQGRLVLRVVWVVREVVSMWTAMAHRSVRVVETMTVRVVSRHWLKCFMVTCAEAQTTATHHSHITVGEVWRNLLGQTGLKSLQKEIS